MRSADRRSPARLLGLRAPPPVAASVVHTGRGSPATRPTHPRRTPAEAIRPIRVVPADLPPLCDGGRRASRASTPRGRLGPPPLMLALSARPPSATRRCRRARLHRSPGWREEARYSQQAFDPVWRTNSTGDSSIPLVPSLHTLFIPSRARPSSSLSILPQGGAQPQGRPQHIAAKALQTLTVGRPKGHVRMEMISLVPGASRPQGHLPAAERMHGGALSLGGPFCRLVHRAPRCS